MCMAPYFLSYSQALSKVSRYLKLVLLNVGVSTAITGLALYIADNQTIRAEAAPAYAKKLRKQGAITLDSGVSIADIVEKVGPAVVRINAAKPVATQVPSVFDDPAFQAFFGDEIPRPPSFAVEQGVGSGFIARSDGLVLTNAHVVNGASRVWVTLKEGSTYEGKVLGLDPVTDVAVVKINASNLPTVSLGNSDAIRPGETAIAIGNPLGLDNTVTTGIISATGRGSRQIGISDKRVSFIQTDAAINPGSSGGPLLSGGGEVIGMNTALIKNAQGLSFAIPIKTVRRIAEILETKGRVAHPYLGLRMTTLTPSLRQKIDSTSNAGIRIAVDRGVLVIRVLPESPAQQAGLRPGDVILKIDGQPMNDAQTVLQVIESGEPGSNVRLELSRNGQNVNVPVRLGNLPAPASWGL